MWPPLRRFLNAETSVRENSIVGIEVKLNNSELALTIALVMIRLGLRRFVPISDDVKRLCLADIRNAGKDW